MESIIIGSFIGIFFAALVPACIAYNKGRSFLVWYFYGLCFFIFAFIHSLVIKPNENAEGMKKCPKCSSIIANTAAVCPFCRAELINSSNGLGKSSAANVVNPNYSVSYNGEININSNEYQLFLTRKYSIERNNTIEKYTANNNVFNNLESALKFANEKYIKSEEDRIAKEKAEKEAAEKKQVDNEVRLQKEVANLASIREDNLFKLFIFIGIGILIIAGIFIYNGISERRELEARDLAEKIKASRLLEESNKKEKIEEIKKNELKIMFSNGNFFGLKLGEANIKKLHELAGRIIIRKPFANSYFIAKCEINQCGEIFSDTSLRDALKAVSFLYCVPDDKESKGDEFYKLMGVEIEFIDEMEGYDYKNFLSKYNYLPTPPKDVNQEFYGNTYLRLKWTKSGEVQKDSSRVSDICDNVRGISGYKVMK